MFVCILPWNIVFNFFSMSIPQNLYFCIIALWVSISRVSRDFLIIIFQMFFGVDCFPPWLQFRTPRVSSVEWVLFSFFFLPCATCVCTTFRALFPWDHKCSALRGMGILLINFSTDFELWGLKLVADQDTKLGERRKTDMIPQVELVN